ncbi:MAG: CBS domain-containing protein [Syntrophobacteraceae bacterium]|nr:CBS domain-containing protein [Syntrophobacteraceae bacterium]
MAVEKRVKDIMSPIEDYNMVQEDDRLCEVLKILRDNYQKLQAREPGDYHKTLFVKNAGGQIVGKLSIFDLVRGLVPESAKSVSPAFLHYRAISMRTGGVEKEIAAIQERFNWLDHSFFDLVKAETQKTVKEVMSPIHPLLEEEDTINKAVYLMFKENIRQPLVARDGKIVGVVSIMCVLPELLSIAGDECFWQ